MLGPTGKDVEVKTPKPGAKIYLNGMSGRQKTRRTSMKQTPWVLRYIIFSWIPFIKSQTVIQPQHDDETNGPSGLVVDHVEVGCFSVNLLSLANEYFRKLPCLLKQKIVECPLLSVDHIG